jgi:hypothetical protein
MMALWLAVYFLGASSALHSWFHSDQASPGHHCVLTVVSHGQVHVTSAELTVRPPEYVEFLPPVAPIRILLESDHWLCPERGPPSFLI